MIRRVKRSVGWSLALAVTLSQGAGAAPGPNIVLFISDDHGVLDCGPYGNGIVRTPNLDRLAGESLMFRRAFAASPTCTPSRCAIYTGLMPFRNGAHANHSTVRKGTPSLPHHLGKLGYRVALAGKVHVRPKDAFPFEYVPGSDVQEPGESRGLHRDLNPAAVDRWLGGLSADERFCLVVAGHSPHVVWPEKAEYDPAKIDLPPTHIDTPETRMSRARYYTDITRMDKRLGDVLSSLAGHGLAENTVFIYTSDQGPQWPFAKWTVYDAGIRVPLIVRWPGTVKPGSVTDAMVSLCDLLPTFIEAAGGTVPDGLDGRSFLGVLRAAADSHRKVIFASHTGDGAMNRSPARCIRTERYKYILNLAPEIRYTTHMDRAKDHDGGREYWDSWVARAGTDPKAAGVLERYHHRPREELYDVLADPHETRNLAGDSSRQAVIADLRRQLAAWRKAQGDDRAGPEPLPPPKWPAEEVPLQARYLLLDDRIIERTDNARLAVGTVQKHPGNPLFGEDRPWEVRFDNLYANILLDEEKGIYRCWYSPFIVDPATSEMPPGKRSSSRYRPRNREMGTCYAVSRDGLRWEKPALGLVDFRGSKENNLVLRGPHGAGIFKDSRDPDPDRRYKLFVRDGPVAVAFSPDGLHWTDTIKRPEVQAPADTHNNAFWAPELRRYVGITRLKAGQRLVGRAESKDFVHWTRAVEVLRGTRERQTYAMPVFRHAGVYLGMLMVFRPREDRVHCELTWTPDTVTWHRIDPGTPLIPNSERPGDYDWGCVYAAAYPVVLDGEIRLYYGASNGPHTGFRDGFLALATLRPDGFAGYEPVDSERPANVLTRPLRWPGGALRITADAVRGSVRVTVLDTEGKPLALSDPITGDVTGARVGFPAEKDPGRHGKAVRLSFELRRAKLYSFEMGTPAAGS